MSGQPPPLHLHRRNTQVPVCCHNPLLCMDAIASFAPTELTNIQREGKLVISGDQLPDFAETGWMTCTNPCMLACHISCTMRPYITLAEASTCCAHSYRSVFSRRAAAKVLATNDNWILGFHLAIRNEPTHQSRSLMGRLPSYRSQPDIHIFF